MPDARSPSLHGYSRFAFPALVALMVVLWVAGGASRADVLGQTVVRAAAWLAIVACILLAPKPSFGSAKPVALFLLAATALVALQLVPLPPALWMALPGREIFAPAAELAGAAQPMRPLSISPSATLNSLNSLVVPISVLTLLVLATPDSHLRARGVILLLIIAGCILALFQFSGSHLDHPLINDVPGDVSGPFANRNHFALLAAIGCLLAPAHALGMKLRTQLALPLAIGLVVLFALSNLATGSRAGLLLAPIGTIIGIFAVRDSVTERLAQWPRKIRVLVIGAAAVAAAGALALALGAGRAASVDRFFSEGVAEGMRGMIRPTVIEMIGKYFPFGTGFGTFDPAFRIDEPLQSLGPLYVNQAHNDLLQVWLDGGLPGGILLLAALGWWAWASARAWRSAGSVQQRLGSGILLLIIIASAFDYPVRTPMIMSLTVFGAFWLCVPSSRQSARSGASERLYPD